MNLGYGRDKLEPPYGKMRMATRFPPKVWAIWVPSWWTAEATQLFPATCSAENEARLRASGAVAKRFLSRSAAS